MKTQNIISESIEMRAINHINKGVDVIEAVKLALIEECDMLGSLITSDNHLTERGEKVSNVISNYVFKKHTRKIKTRIV